MSKPNNKTSEPVGVFITDDEIEPSGVASGTEELAAGTEKPDDGISGGNGSTEDVKSEPFATVDPFTGIIRSGEPRRKRGRPAGSRNGESIGTTAKRLAVSTDLGDIKDLLLSVHEMGAALLKAPGLRLDDDEARKLARVAAELSAEFGVGMTKRQKVVTNAIATCGGIYGKRIVSAIADSKTTPKANLISMPNAPKQTAASPNNNGAAKAVNESVPLTTPSQLNADAPVDNYEL